MATTDIRPTITLAYRLQAQLHHQEEQAERPRPGRAEEVLPLVRPAHRPPGTR